MVEQLNEQARLTPQRTALVWDGGSLDYAGLHQQANRLAHYLRDKGVGPDTCVAIAIERSPQLLVGLLAILKAGGATCRWMSITLPNAWPTCWPTATPVCY